MVEVKDNQPTLEEATAEQPDSEDPNYLAWRQAKIRAALREADENPDDVATLEEMRETFGLAG